MTKRKSNRATLNLALDTTKLVETAERHMAAAAEVVAAITSLVRELAHQRESASRRKKTVTETLSDATID